MFISLLLKKGRYTKEWPFFLFIILFSITISSCTSNKKEFEPEILASIDDFEITTFEFETRYVEHLIKFGRNDTKRQRYIFLNELIDKTLLAQQALNNGFQDHGSYTRTVEYQTRKEMIDFYFSDEMGKILEGISDDELRLAFAKSKRTVYVRHLFSKDQRDLLLSLQKLDKGESFLDVANEYYNTAEYDSSAGYLGPISFFNVDDAFAEAAFSTNIGEYTRPIRSLFGYHIIYVEYIEFPQILAEDEYQYKKTGLSSQLRLRNQELKANSYIQNLMGTLLIEVDRQKVLDLKKTIEELSDDTIIDLTNSNETQTSDLWSDNQFFRLSSSFDKNSVLANYVFKGERIDFTFQDYLNWLPFLSYKESRDRTGASLGRAMRNEVLKKLSQDEEYQNDERVKKAVKYKSNEVLSNLYQSKLAREALKDTKKVKVPSEFRDQLVRNKEFEMIASYWTIPVKDISEGEKIKNELKTGGKPESYSEFNKIENKKILLSNPDYTLIKDGLINTPLIARSENNEWFLISILERNIKEINRKDDPNNVTGRFKIFNYISKETTELRQNATIKIDTVLFDKIYDIYRKAE